MAVGLSFGTAIGTSNVQFTLCAIADNDWLDFDVLFRLRNEQYGDQRMCSFSSLSPISQPRTFTLQKMH